MSKLGRLSVAPATPDAAASADPLPEQPSFEEAAPESGSTEQARPTERMSKLTLRELARSTAAPVASPERSAPPAPEAEGRKIPPSPVAAEEAGHAADLEVPLGSTSAPLNWAAPMTAAAPAVMASPVTGAPPPEGAATPPVTGAPRGAPPRPPPGARPGPSRPPPIPTDARRKSPTGVPLASPAPSIDSPTDAVETSAVPPGAFDAAALEAAPLPPKLPARPSTRPSAPPASAGPDSNPRLARLGTIASSVLGAPLDPGSAARLPLRAPGSSEPPPIAGGEIELAPPEPLPPPPRPRSASSLPPFATDPGPLPGADPSVRSSGSSAPGPGSFGGLAALVGGELDASPQLVTDAPPFPNLRQGGSELPPFRPAPSTGPGLFGPPTGLASGGLPRELGVSGDLDSSRFPGTPPPFPGPEPGAPGSSLRPGFGDPELVGAEPGFGGPERGFGDPAFGGPGPGFGGPDPDLGAAPAGGAPSPFSVTDLPPPSSGRGAAPGARFADFDASDSQIGQAIDDALVGDITGSGEVALARSGTFDDHADDDPDAGDDPDADERSYTQPPTAEQGFPGPGFPEETLRGRGFELAGGLGAADPATSDPDFDAHGAERAQFDGGAVRPDARGLDRGDADELAFADTGFASASLRGTPDPDFDPIDLPFERGTSQAPGSERHSGDNLTGAQALGVSEPIYGDPGQPDRGLAGDISQPGFDPGFGARGFSEPGFGDPGFGARGYGDSGFGGPGSGARGFGDPGTGPRGFGDPGFGDPAFGARGFGEQGSGAHAHGDHGLSEHDPGHLGFGEPGPGARGPLAPVFGDPAFEGRGPGSQGYGDHGPGNGGFGDPAFEGRGMSDRGPGDHAGVALAGPDFSGFSDLGPSPGFFPDRGPPPGGFPGGGFPDRGFPDRGYPDRSTPEPVQHAEQSEPRYAEASYRDPNEPSFDVPAWAPVFGEQVYGDPSSSDHGGFPAEPPSFRPSQRRPVEYYPPDQPEPSSSDHPEADVPPGDDELRPAKAVWKQPHASSRRWADKRRTAGVGRAPSPPRMALGLLLAGLGAWLLLSFLPDHKPLTDTERARISKQAGVDENVWRFPPPLYPAGQGGAALYISLGFLIAVRGLIYRRRVEIACRRCRRIVVAERRALTLRCESGPHPAGLNWGAIILQLAVLAVTIGLVALIVIVKFHIDIGLGVGTR